MSISDILLATMRGLAFLEGDSRKGGSNEPSDRTSWLRAWQKKVRVRGNEKPALDFILTWLYRRGHKGVKTTGSRPILSLIQLRDQASKNKSNSKVPG